MVGRPVVDHRSSATIRNPQTNSRDGLIGAAVNQEDTATVVPLDVPGEAATSRQHVPKQNVYLYIYTNEFVKA